jgi:hypothetical protein
MATQLLSGENCNFTGSACITLARLAVDIIGNDDFLSDAAQNSFVLDLVSAVGPTIAFDAIARQLWRINQYTPYGSGAYTYAYPPALSGCPSSFLITHDILHSTSLELSNEQQRVLAAFINARVSVADLLVVCPFHVLMAFCKWLHAGNSNKVMSLDGSIQYNTSYNNGVYAAYQNTYDAYDYLGNAIYYYQLTSLVQTSTRPIFDASYSASSIMSGLVLDTIYDSANTAELKHGLVATLILAVDSQNPLRAGYGNISNAYDVSTTDGLTITRSATRNATKLDTASLSAYTSYISSNLPRTTHNNGVSVILGKQLTNENKNLITATNLTAQQYFDAYLLTGVASDISILKAANYTVGEISGIKDNGAVAVPEFQVVSNYITSGFLYSQIITGLKLSTPQQYFEKVVYPLNLSDLSAIAMLKNPTFGLDASGLYSITLPNSSTKKFNDARDYLTSGFDIARDINPVFNVTDATSYYNTYHLGVLDVVDRIINLKTYYSISQIKAISYLSNSTPRDFKEAGYTFDAVYTDFSSQLLTASDFYTAFNGSSAFNKVTNTIPFYSAPQQIFIMKKLQYACSGVYAIMANGNRVYNSIHDYSYKVVAEDTVLKTNISAINDEESFSTKDINEVFGLNNAQTILNVYNLPNERESIYKIKRILPTVKVSDLKSVTRGSSPLSAFQIPKNYLGSLSLPGAATPVDGYTFEAIKTGFSLTTASSFYNAFNGSPSFNDLSNNTPFYSVPQQIFIFKKMDFSINDVHSIVDASNSKIYNHSESYSYIVTAGDTVLKANVPAETGDKSYNDSVAGYFNYTSAQNIANVLSLANERASIYKIKQLLPTVKVSDIRNVRIGGQPLSAFNDPSNYSGSFDIQGISNTVSVAGYSNTEITEGFFGDFNLLVGVTSATSLPRFTYVDATYTENGHNLLTKLQDLSSGYTSWRTLLKDSINEIKPQNQRLSAIGDLSGNDVKNAVYRVVYLSSVMNSDTSGTPFSPTTAKGLYAFFDLPTFISSYTANGTKPYDFLNHSEYLTYSTAASMVAPSATVNKIAKSSTTGLVTAQEYTAYPSGISFTLYDGNNTTTVRYSLGSVAANTWHLNSSSVAVNNAPLRYFDSGYSITTAISLINSTNKVGVIATSGWPIASHILVTLKDTVDYIKSSFYNPTKTMDENITAAKSLPFSADAWNFTNLINGPINNANTLLNLDGVSWKQLVGAASTDANVPNAITADLAANVNFITVPLAVTESQLVSMFNIPLSNALTVANKLNTATDAGRTTTNNKWTLSGIAGSQNYSKTQRKQLFNSSALLAAQVLDSDAFIKLYWSPTELAPLKDKLELSDLLTVTEEITAEWGTDYTASANSSYIRMIYHTTTERTALVRIYYPTTATLSDASANALAVLTNKSDIVDYIARI